MGRLSRHVLAAYYNDARLNIRDCLNDIRQKTGRSEIENDDQNKNSFQQLNLAEATPEEQKFLIKQLRNRFRFLDVLADAQPDRKDRDKKPILAEPKDYHITLSWMFELVHELRNAKTHAVEKDFVLTERQHKRLFHALKTIYDAALGTVKLRFQYDEKIIKPLRLYDRNGNTKKSPQFPLALCGYWNEKKYRNNRREPDVLYDFGHVLFCSLFLDRTQSAELLSYYWQAGYENRLHPGQQKIIHELVGIYRTRPPLRRLRSDISPEAVTMDTVSYLSRCPRILFDSLCKKDQEKFRVVPMTDPAAGGLDSPTTFLYDRGRSRFTELLLHFFDFNTAPDTDSRLRFAVDLGQLYYNVRIKPGDGYTDNKPRVRRLSRKMIGYGRLTDFDYLPKPEKKDNPDKPDSEQEETNNCRSEEKQEIVSTRKPDIWQQLEKSCESSAEEAKQAVDQAVRNPIDSQRYLTPYIVPCNPHYHYFADKIGFRIQRDKNNNNPAAYPHIACDELGRKPIEPLKNEEMEPEFWLSPRQLPALAFYIHLQKNGSGFPRPDHLFSQYKSGMIRVYNDLLNDEILPKGTPFSKERKNNAQNWLNERFRITGRNGFSIEVELSDMPKVVVHHLLGRGKRKIPAEEIRSRAESMLAETSRKLEVLKNMVGIIKKRGKKGFKPIKCGHIADFLTDDLLRFQPIDNSRDDGGKLNSQQYQILQASLAYYSVHLDEPPQIVDLLKDAGLLEGRFAHPFLACLGLKRNPNKYSGLLSFYEDYLRKRRGYLKGFIDNIAGGKITQPPKWQRLRQASTLENWLREQKRYPGNGENGDTRSLRFTGSEQIKPLPIPKNFFNQPLLAMTAQGMGLEPTALEEKGTRRFVRNGSEVSAPPAVSWLIKHYFQEKYEDETQKMYRYRRGHALFDTFLDERKMKGRQKFQPQKNHFLLEPDRKKYLGKIHEKLKSGTPCRQILENKQPPNRNDAEKRQAKLCKLLRLYKRREKAIRFLGPEDIILYLYAGEHLNIHLSGTANLQADLKLKNIRNTVFNTPISYKLKMEGVAGADKVLYHPQFKLKNLGEFRLQVRDRRLPGLLLYYPEEEKEFHIMEIRAELVDYRRTRVRVMKKVHELEREISACCGRELDELRKKLLENKDEKRKRTVLYHREIIEIFQRRMENELRKNPVLAARYGEAFTQEKFDQAIELRNAMAHNIYPKRKFFPDIVKEVQAESAPENPANHRKVAARLYSELEGVYTVWLRCLRDVREETVK